MKCETLDLNSCLLVHSKGYYYALFHCINELIDFQMGAM